MTRRKTAFLLIVLVIVAVALGYFFVTNLRKNSGIRIETYPKSKVLIDGKEWGDTPFYKEGMEAKEYAVKLVPENGNLLPYIINVSLSSQTLTVLTRVFNSQQELSSGEIITLEKSSVDAASLSVVSDPDAVIVKIDGEDKGLSPLAIKDLSAGVHEIVVSKPGYDTQTVNGNLTKGFDLHLVVKLPKSIDLGTNIGTNSAVIVASPSGAQKKQVLILSTPTGFLRVRVLPSLGATESGRVSPGEKYDLLSEKSDWIEIKISSGSGWVSSLYAQKINN